tara:strand:+ start:614 stop:796 length:183 start_codon:yes stop_codon:yes gene_type:complete
MERLFFLSLFFFVIRKLEFALQDSRRRKRARVRSRTIIFAASSTPETFLDPSKDSAAFAT